MIRHRRTATVIGLICLWLSTVGALHHDEIIGVHPSTHPQAVLGHFGLLADSGPCTACEWEQMIGSSQTVQVTVLTLPALITRQTVDRLVQPVILRHFSYASLRAPPVA